MSDVLDIVESIDIDAPRNEVFDALTDPHKVEQYFFGTHVETDWSVGSPITWSGEWKGHTYKDKGEVLAFTQDELIETTYWSAMSGNDDVPENYQNVKYELSDRDGKTRVILTQSNILSQESRDHSQEGWRQILIGLKELCEN